MRKSKIAAFFKKYINGTKGVVSLFLAILMVPFVTIAGALINAGRINSAVAIFDEAMCNASNSTLGTYDSFLRSRFALMAVSQDPTQGTTNQGLPGVNYTAEHFVNDLFCYYMEQNLGSLSNTYDSTKLSAEGLYPLADPAVLRSSVLQASKVMVPAKLAVDWGSLDDMLNQLTEPFDMFSTIGDTITSGVKVTTAIDKLAEKQDGVENQIKACNKARTNYNDAYNDFAEAAKAFNTLVDNINNTAEDVDTYQKQVNAYKQQIGGLESQIQQKKADITELEEDEEVDHSAEITALETEIQELEDKIEEVAPGYDDAKDNLSDAESDLKRYKNQFSKKQTNLVNAKNAYYTKTSELRTEIYETRDKAIEFQSACTSLVNEGATLVSNVTKTGLEMSKNSIDKQKEQLNEENEYYRYQKTLAEGGGYTEEATEYYNMIQENESTAINLDETKLKYSNAGKVTGTAVSTMKNVSSGLTDFAERDLTGEYKEIYDKLGELMTTLNNRSVPNDYSKIKYSDCKYEVVNPIEKGDISEIIKNIEDQIVNNSGWAALKAIVSFINGLFDVKFFYDSELNATINTANYSANGGLPSKIDRDKYPLTSSHAAEDAALSQEYKEMLNAYSVDGAYATEGGGESEIEKMMGYITTIKDLIDPFKLENLSKLWDAVGGLINSMVTFGANFVANGVKTIAKGLGERLLIIGYISYNTANRTTYNGSALTGSGFDLPQTGSDNDYAFYGAETEYIIKGKLSEKENQEGTFTAVWVERILFDLVAVLGDPTIQTIATTIGSFTFGIGTVVTYIVVLAAEALVDAIILVNGGELPILKSYVYLTPAGIPRLLKQVCSLQLSDALQQSIYEKSCEAANKMNKNAQEKALEHGKYAGEDDMEFPVYKDYKANTKAEDKKFSNIFTLDYTKSLQLIMLLTGNTEKMLARLADLIQMEASYKSHQDMITYEFNLDYSYTYVRASGDFSSGVFIQISEEDSYSSKHRVVYNGY